MIIKRNSEKRNKAREVLKQYIQDHEQFTSVDITDHIVQSIGCSLSMAYSVLKEASYNGLIENIGKDPTKGKTDNYRRV